MAQDNKLKGNRPAQPIAVRPRPNAGPRSAPNMPLSTQGGPVRRAIFRSQIPIRIQLQGQGPTTPHTHAHSRVIEHRMRNLQPFSTPQNPNASSQRPYSNANAAHHVARSLAETQSLVKNIEAAFTVYGERLQADLRDFRTLCTTLVMQEQQEKEQWHSLCIKIMKERDAARVRVQALLSGGREAHPGAPRTSSPPNDTGSIRGAKRGREDPNATVSEAMGDASPRSKSSEPRPLRSLRSSPTPSPPGSPSRVTGHPSLSPTESSPPPPNSAESDQVPSTPTPIQSAPPSLTTFRATATPSPTPSSGSNKSDQAAPECQPPMKRRKSCDSSLSTCSTTTLVDRSQERMTNALRDSNGAACRDVKLRLHSRSPVATEHLPLPVVNPTGAPCLPGEFSHVDIMYVPVNGSLVCRACLLDSTKPSAMPMEPKAFPTNASWDALRDHCIREHPSACVDVARLHPAEVFELRRRLNM
ncbi:hypothetical protein BDZ97DRAFT_1931128 [Flammula alnicola]|nr:hypothetical protein BDZ97DRAFT_1931128 [Flammula alnicola]